MLTATLVSLVVASSATVQDSSAREQVLREYRDIATLISMDHAQGESVRLLLKRVAGKRAGQLIDLDPKHPYIRSTAQAAVAVCEVYGVAWHSMNDSTQALMGEGMLLGMKAMLGSQDSIDRGLDDFSTAFRTHRRIANASVKLFWEAKVQHNEAWELLQPIADRLAGPEVDGMPIAPGLLYLSRKINGAITKQLGELRLTNQTNHTLTNVTVCFDSSQNAFRENEAEPHWFFVDQWSPGESIRLPLLLVSNLTSVAVPEPIPAAANLQVWCDQFRWQGRNLRLFETVPKMLRKSPRVMLYRYSTAEGESDAPELPGAPELVPGELRREVDRLIALTSKGKRYEGLVTEPDGREMKLAIDFISFDDQPNHRAARITFFVRHDRKQIKVLNGRLSVSRNEDGSEVDSLRLVEAKRGGLQAELELVFSEDGAISGFGTVLGYGPRECEVELEPASR
ncbi:hypothetical protein [Tautonia sociabilis]|uniref:Uncharacterized protein n=1 Tax=Tautonia sociabilis TaxID=2080755 RepID=A0A432MEW6_9BACT|nr:hypothetical protein [Tautonia sociabilis]RUL84226.1 hypothetical protein TsocGM_20770 [Tautonia sociabilis]